jgi:hypothetical protein
MILKAKLYILTSIIHHDCILIYNNIHRRLNSNEDDAIAFLANYDSEYGPLINQYVIASWNYETNLTDENALAVVSIH